MAVAFPTTYDALSNPTSSSYEDDVSVPHAQQHSDANDILELLEAKIGKGASSPVTTGHLLQVTGAGGATGYGLLPAGSISSSAMMSNEIVTPTQMAYPPVQVNQLVNGGFEVWQRIANAASWAVNGASAGADGWLISVGGTSLTCTRETTTKMIDSKYSIKCVSVGANNQIYQKIENFEALRGRKITFSCWVWTATAASLKISVYDGTTQTFSTIHTGGSDWEQLTVTATMSNTATLIQLGILAAVATTFYADNAVLAFGTGLTPYIPMPTAIELDLCQRRFEIHNDSAGGSSPGLLGYSSAGTESWCQGVLFHTKKGGSPTLTKNGTWTVVNAGQPTVDQPNTDGYRFVMSAIGVGAFAVNGGTTANITAEWNP